MKHVLFFFAFVAIAFFGLMYIVDLYDANMKWGRMHDTPAVRPHEAPLLIMEAGTVPFKGGEEQLKVLLAENAVLPHSHSTSSAIENGKNEYQVFCSHCHGNDMDGHGTVGQSFNPLPTDLLSEQVTAKSDNDLFLHISYGGERSPALATSMTKESRWAVISYLRFRQAQNQ